MTTLVIVAVVLAWLLATTTYAEPVVPGPASDAELPAVPAAHDDRAGRRGAVRHGAGARGAGALAGSYRHGARGDRGVRGRGGRCGRGRRPVLVASIVGLLLTAALAALRAGMRKR